MEIYRGFFAYIGNIGRQVMREQVHFMEREMRRKQKQHEKNRTEHPNVQLVEHEHDTPLDYAIKKKARRREKRTSFIDT
jgi:hypothetical protein